MHLAPDRGRDVRNPAVMPDENRRSRANAARCGNGRFFANRTGLSFQAVSSRASRSSSASPADHEQTARSDCEEVFAEFDPIFDRPIFRFASAAGMKRDEWCSWSRREIRRATRDRFRSDKSSPQDLSDESPISFERPRELTRRVFAAAQLRRARNQTSLTPQRLRFVAKDLVRIEEVTHDQIEAAEVFDQLRLASRASLAKNVTSGRIRSSESHRHKSASPPARRCACNRGSRCAPRKSSRKSFIAGRVRTKSPIAPPRMTRMRFNALSAMRDIAREARRNQYRVTRRRESPPRRAGQDVRQSPAPGPARAPINLIAQQIRHHDPEQSDHDQQIGEHRHEKPACFGTEKKRHRERFGRQAEKECRARGRREIHPRTSRREKNRWAG